MYLFLGRISFAIFIVLFILGIISIFNKKFRSKKLYISIPIVLMIPIMTYVMDMKRDVGGTQVVESKIKKKHIDILDTTKTYEEMSGSERATAIEIVEDYWDDLTTEQQNKYTNRKDEILKTKDEVVKKIKEEDIKKTEEFNAKYSDIPYSEVRDNTVIDKAKSIVTSKVNDTLSLKDKFKIVDASATKMTIEVLDPEFTNGGAVALQNLIFDAYQEAGLARGSNYVIEITAIVKCGKATKEASWKLGESPVRKE